jgi:hypothetical protein
MCQEIPYSKRGWRLIVLNKHLSGITVSLDKKKNGKSPCIFHQHQLINKNFDDIGKNLIASLVTLPYVASQDARHLKSGQKRSFLLQLCKQLVT